MKRFLKMPESGIDPATVRFEVGKCPYCKYSIFVRELVPLPPELSSSRINILTHFAGYYLQKSQGTTYGNRGVLPIKIAEYYLLFLQGTTYFLQGITYFFSGYYLFFFFAGYYLVGFAGYYLLFCGVLPTFLRGTTHLR